MKVNTVEELKSMMKIDPTYDYAGRAGYYAKAAGHIYPKHKRILEIGPWRCPLVADADFLDVADDTGLEIKYLHDATSIPWPIENGAYDLIIALQFLEHCGKVQKQVFQEMRRVATDIVISLPYCWETSDNVHNGIDMAVINDWTGGLKPTSTEYDVDRLNEIRIVLSYMR